MNPKDGAFTMGLDRFNALLTGRGSPNASGNGGLDEPMKRFQAFALDIQKAYGEGLSRQADPSVAATDQFVRSLPGLLLSRKLRDIAAARSQVFAAFVKSALPWTRTWGEFVQKSGDRRAAFARATAQELHNQSAAEPAIAEARKPAMQP